MTTINSNVRRILKSTLRRFTWQLRRVTWRSRVLPDFIIIGAQRSGTTSLYHYLTQHPQLHSSFAKEVHYFDAGLDPEEDNFQKGHAWYQAHFPLRSQVKAGDKVFEASPLYIFNPLAPERICDLVPDAKLIASLRNPTERAISHYFHEVGRGTENLPIMQALQEEDCRLEPVMNARDWKSVHYIDHSYKKRGLYKEQLERYMECFPIDCILVLCSEDLFQDPVSTLKEIYRFVEVDEGFQIENLEPQNVGAHKVEVDQEVYEYLNDYFRPHNEALFELIGKRFDWDGAGGLFAPPGSEPSPGSLPRAIPTPSP